MMFITNCCFQKFPQAQKYLLTSRIKIQFFSSVTDKVFDLSSSSVIKLSGTTAPPSSCILAEEEGNRSGDCRES